MIESVKTKIKEQCWCNTPISQNQINTNMKTLKILLLLAFTSFTIALAGCNNQANKSSDELNGKDSCLTKKNFDLVKNFITQNGVQIKLYKAGIMADTSTMSKQLFFNGKTIVLIDYKNYNHIIVIDKFNEDKIPAYFVSNESDPCPISAYYSYLETEESIKTRTDNWNKIVAGIHKAKPDTIFVDRENALKIAQRDAQISYRDLSIYTIKVELNKGNWLIDYNLSDPQMVGGGPHYIICSKSGNILTRRYEQ
jgi:hypothetical protein